MIHSSWKPMWQRYHAIRNMLLAAPRPELEQAVLRLLVSALIVAYMAWYRSQPLPATVLDSTVLAFGTLFFGTAAIIAVRVIVSPGVSVARRLLGMVADNAATTYTMLLLGEGGAVIIGVYLFVALGNGFRFGRRYLHYSQVMALVGFATVLVVSPFWSQHTAIGLGFLLTLGVVPLYAGVLAERINDARKRADDANIAKGRFLANVSHEMRTPLNGVIAMADLLRETPLNALQKEITETLANSTQLLLAQIEDVLDISKIESGRVTIHKRSFDIKKVVDATVSVVLPQATSKGLKVSIDIDSSTPPLVKGDDHHLRQILLNLLANAVKFTQIGEVTVRVRALDSDARRIRFEVRDTGIGIPADKQGLIFEAFVQADDSITRVYGGTGLGTTIARQLVKTMGGEIGVNSLVGVGSTFWVELPFEEGTADAVVESRESAADKRFALSASALTLATKHVPHQSRGARVLVAEDNQTNQRVIRLILESQGHYPTIVSNGEEALDELHRNRFDIALFDLSMPVLSGFDALRAYRFIESDPIPVLILSANVTPDLIDQCKGAGCAEFIPKPLRADSVLDAIARHTLGVIPQATLAAPIPEARPALALVENPYLDVRVVSDLQKLSPDPSFMARFASGFCDDAQRLTKEIQLAVNQQQYESTKDLAHALKGAAGSVGACRLLHIATKLERTGHDVLAQKADELIVELRQCVERTIAELETRTGSSECNSTPRTSDESRQDGAAAS